MIRRIQARYHGARSQKRCKDLTPKQRMYVVAGRRKDDMPIIDMPAARLVITNLLLLSCVSQKIVLPSSLPLWEAGTGRELEP